MRWSWKREIFPFGVIVLFVLLCFYFYPKLPDIIPSHFDLHGKPDKFTSKTDVTILRLGLIVCLYVTLTFIPFINPF